MTHGSLFSGIGGFDLGFERAGIKTVWQVEIDPYCRKVLARHFPDAQRFDDVRTVGKHNLPTVDILSGGFPCQDVSHAGRRIGIRGSRSGLWWEMSRIIGELRPRYVVVENTSGLLDRGFGDVLAELAGMGFDAEWGSLSACAFGAPHTRKRVFVVAYAAGERPGQLRRRQCPPEGPQNGDLHWTTDEPPCERVVDGVPFRMDRLRGLGNAIIPQIAEWIGKRIVEADRAYAQGAEGQ